MPRKALRCVVDVTLHAVTCPGVWVPRRDDVFVSLKMFGQLRRTQLMTPVFPLIIHEKFRFDKVFHSAFEPSKVADSLEAEPLVIELIQISDIYEGGRLLAEHCCSARDFLYPYPSYSTTYGTQDREILLDASIDFPGIAPKLEFSTNSLIKETNADVVGLDHLDEPLMYSSNYGRHSGYGHYDDRSICRTSKGRKRRYGDPTIASITRSRSISPSISSKLGDLCLDECLDDKPPFVVRKVDKSLIGRIPGNKYSPHHRRRSASPGRSLSRSYGSGLYDSYLDDSYTVRPSYSYSKAGRDDYYSARKAIPLKSKDTDLNALDLGVSSPRSRGHKYLSSSYASSLGYPRPTTATSYYHSTLADRFGDRAYSPTASQIISSRVDQAIQHHRSLERLNDTYGRTKIFNSGTESALDSLDELALEFEKSRRRYV